MWEALGDTYQKRIGELEFEGKKNTPDWNGAKDVSEKISHFE